MPFQFMTPMYGWGIPTGPWDLTGASYDNVSFALVRSDGTSLDHVGALRFGDSGSKMFVTNSVFDEVGYTDESSVYQFSLSTPWDLSTASALSGTLNASSNETTIGGLDFKTDGTKAYVVGGFSQTIYQYGMSTAWDVSTATYDSVSFSVSTEGSGQNGLYFKSDGTKLYVLSAGDDTVYQYNLMTAWDLSTASFTNSKSVGSEDTGSTGIFFKDDGTRMFMIGSANDAVYQYSLSTAWDISTASYDSTSFTVSGQNNLPTGLAFKSDGLRMYVDGREGGVGNAYQYSL